MGSDESTRPIREIFLADCLRKRTTSDQKGASVRCFDSSETINHANDERHRPAGNDRDRSTERVDDREDGIEGTQKTLRAASPDH
jgi:hypothetical protein